MSAQAFLFGQFDFNKTPLVPPGTKVVSHSKPGNRTSWSYNGEEGWTVAPAIQHYRCIKCFFPKTRTERVTDTVVFFPHDIDFPKVDLDDFLQQATQDIITILTNPTSSTTVSLKAGDTTRNALLELATMLNRTTNLQKISEVPTTTTSASTTPLPRVQQTIDKTTNQIQQPLFVTTYDLNKRDQ